MTAPSAPVRLLQMILGSWVSQAISVAAEMRVADELAAGPRSAEEVARSLGAHPGTLYRLLRALAAVGVLTELDGRRFELTEMGQFLRTDSPESMSSLARFINRPYKHISWADLPESIRTGECAFERQYGEAIFDYFTRHPDEAEIMDNAMTAISAQNIGPLVSAYDFGQFETIMDVGGGHGSLLAAILRANPGARGVLYDLPHVVAGSGPRLEEVGLGERCECVGGDFLKSVPGGSDAYVLCNVIHDWDDERAEVILRNCRDAVNPGGAVLIGERVLKEGPGNDPLPLLVDLEMLAVASGGRERTRPEFAILLERSGLHIERIIPTPGMMSIIEATPA